MMTTSFSPPVVDLTEEQEEMETHQPDPVILDSSMEEESDSDDDLQILSDTDDQDDIKIEGSISKSNHTLPEAMNGSDIHQSRQYVNGTNKFAKSDSKIAGRRKKPPTVVDLTEEDKQSGESESEEPMQTDPPPSGPRATTSTSTTPSTPTATATRTTENMVGVEDDDDLMVLSDGGKDVPQVPLDPTKVEDMANIYKEGGNDYFKKKEYEKAIEMYGKAIGLRQFEHQYYGNRSACYLMVGRYNEAMVDARKSVQIDPTFEKGYQRLFRSTLHLGDIVACEAVLNIIKGLPQGVNVNVSGENNTFLRLKDSLAQVKKDLDKKDYRKALYTVGIALSIATADLGLATTKAEILYCLGRYQEANQITIDVLQKDPNRAEAWFVGGKCNYQIENERCTNFLKRALQIAPDSSTMQSFFKKNKQLTDLRMLGRDLFSKANYVLAKEKYTEALVILESPEMKNHSIESKLCYNLSLIAQRTNSLDEALVMCNKAVDLNPDYLKAYFSRASLYFQKEMFDESVKDYDKLTKMDPANRDYKIKLHEATIAAKRAKRKDYYKILGVGKNATEAEMKKAYKKGALTLHPDRHSNASDSVQKHNEQQFKELGEAYEILTDPKKRSRYDMGEDLNEPQAGFEQFDPNQLFNVFYSMGAQPRHSHGYHQHYRTAPGGCPR